MTNETTPENDNTFPDLAEAFYAGDIKPWTDYSLDNTQTVRLSAVATAFKMLTGVDLFSSGRRELQDAIRKLDDLKKDPYLR